MKHYTEKTVFSEGENLAMAFHTSSNEDIHLHDFVELVYIFGGKGYQYVDDRKYSVLRGDMLFINYGHTHAFTASRGMEYYNIYLKPALISEELINTDNAMQMLSLTAFEDFRETVGGKNPVVRFSGSEIPEIESCLAAMMREYQNKSNGTGTILKSYLMILLTYIFRKMAVYEEPHPGAAGSSIDELIRYIEANCTQHLSLTQLSEKCFYNPSYFCRIFKEYSGKTVLEFIHENRIKRACGQLLCTKDSIAEISLDAGYTSRTQFYKKFRELMGVSPAEYRKNGGNAV